MYGGEYLNVSADIHADVFWEFKNEGYYSPNVYESNVEQYAYSVKADSSVTFSLDILSIAKL
jgi:hypothetical protein